MSEKFVIRPVSQFEEMAAIQNIQRLAWDMLPDADLVPLNFFKAAAYNGGQVLAAYDGDQPVGFVLSIPGVLNKPKTPIEGIKSTRYKLHSVMMGIHPDYQNRGIGFQLKVAQREFARKQGVQLISWTFDPLMSRNAWLNLTKLGAVIETYELSYYGSNDGWPQDRFVVDWWISSNRVEARIRGQRQPLPLEAFISAQAEFITCEWDPSDYPLPPESGKGGVESVILLEFPADIAKIRQAAPAVALKWRHYLREALTHYFERDYLLTDVVRDAHCSGEERVFYVLTKRE